MAAFSWATHVKDLLHKLHIGLRGSYAQYRLLYERQYLRDRPWLEESLHWSLDGQLHGHIALPPMDRRRSVTSDGWCPGYASTAKLRDSEPL